jgi:hypothetical protein
VTASRECAWAAKPETPWVTVAGTGGGQGSGSFSFTVAANADPTVRNGGIAVNEQRVGITQQGAPCQFTLSSTQEQVPAAGDERTVRVRASSARCEWTARAEQAWIVVVAGDRGAGDGEVRFRVEAANGPPRMGALSIAGRTVQIVQGSGCAVSVNPASITLPSGGGAGRVSVQTAAGCSWSAVPSADWIAVSPATGAGAASVTVSVPPYAGPARNGSVRVGDQTVGIVQGSGCSVAVQPSSLAVPAAGGKTTVQVAAGEGCPWSASGSAPWISIEGGGAGPGSLHLTIAPNTGPARQAAVSVAGVPLTVSQANGCTYDVSTRRQDASAGGGAHAIGITTGDGCPWTTSSAVDWISIAPAAGAGPAQAQLTVGPNSGPPRAAAVTIAGSRVEVAQASRCTFQLVPPFLAYEAGGGNGAVLVIVIGGCTWSASTTTPWITMTSGTSGSGDGVVQFVVAPNAGPARTGTVNIAGQDYGVQQGGR